MCYKIKRKIKKCVISIYVILISLISNKSSKTIKKEMKNLKKTYDISYSEYIKNKLYKKSKAELKKYLVGKNNINISLVSEIKGITYEEAKKEMDFVKSKYNINYNEYTGYKLFKYKTKKGLEKRIVQLKEKDEKYINEVCRDTGWPYEKALEEAKRAKKLWGLSYKKYSRYRFYSMSYDEQQAKIDKWNSNYKKYIEIAMKESGWPKNKVAAHMKRYGVLYDIYQAYYILYKGWELSDEEMDSYARQKISEILWSRYNDPEEARVLAEKDKFLEVYKDYTKRKYWINKNTNFNEFKEFAKDLNYVFCKPIESGGGLGTEKHKVTKNLDKLYKLLMSKDALLVEECIEQHEEIDEFIPGCVCTIRVICIIDKNDKCHVICSGIRLGNKGSIADNLSKGGMCADINVETGIIQTNAIDEDGNIYEVHPVSGKKFKGFQIPHWDKVIDLAKNAMYVQKGINYVGWDIAICKDKAVIVEGNTMPDLIIVQAPYAPEKKGMKYLFDPFLNERNEKNENSKKQKIKENCKENPCKNKHKKK